MLVELAGRLKQSGVELRFAEMKSRVMDKFERFELMPVLGEPLFHPTLGAAVDAYLADHHVDWKP
jgi:hypothetical protein